MYRQHLTGTPLQLKTQIALLKLPDDLPCHEAIRAIAMAHIPTYEMGPWELTIVADSATNTGGSRMVGFVSVSTHEH